MSTKDKNIHSTDIASVLGMLSDFQAGNFSRTLTRCDDPSLKPLIDKMNETARVLESQVQTLTQCQAYNDVSFIIHSLGIGIWKWDLVTNSLEWDENMYRLYGADPKDFSGAYEAWENSLSSETKAKAIEEINIAVAGGKAFDTTFQVVHKNSGKIQEIRTRAFVVRDSSGKALKMWGVNIDRNREAQTEREREELHNLLQVVLDNVPSMIFAKDFKRNLCFSLFNKAGENLLGVNRGQILGKNDYDLFPKEQADFFTLNDKKVLEKGSLVKIEKEEISTPKGVRILETYKVPTYDHNGHPQLLIGISNDITEDYKLRQELELERIKSVKNAKLASLGEMSAGIAHEINNPLSIILGSVGLLSKFKENPEKWASKIEAIQKSCDRIARIVSGLRKFSRSGEKSSFAPHDLCDISQEVLILTESKSKRHHTSVSVECLTHVHILCDEVEIEQVMVNLINNAIDAVKSSNEKWVKVSIFEEGASVVMRVMDSGPGIPESVRDKLFHPFFTTKKVGEGTGLGLSITKGILDEHRATIGVVADCPNTCFEVKFPKVVTYSA